MLAVIPVLRLSSSLRWRFGCHSPPDSTLRKTAQSRMLRPRAGGGKGGTLVKYGKGWIAVALLALLSPLGLLAVGAAWGEWDLGTIQEKVGFRPRGMERTAQESPTAPIPDYEIPGLPEEGAGPGLGAVLSALIGAGLTAGSALLIARLTKHGTIS